MNNTFLPRKQFQTTCPTHSLPTLFYNRTHFFLASFIFVDNARLFPLDHRVNLVQLGPCTMGWADRPDTPWALTVRSRAAVAPAARILAPPRQGVDTTTSPRERASALAQLEAKPGEAVGVAGG